MKKLLILLLLLTMLLSLAACGGKPGSSSPSDLQTPTPPTLPPTEEPTAPAAENALALMNAVWALYGEDETFSAVGGSFEDPTEDGPGVYDVSDAAMLDSDFGLPAAAADKVDEAASLRHMMNVNTFTGVAFHVKAADDVQAVADALKENVLKREWMCGFPDKLVIILVDDYVISVFGNEELVDSFKTKTLAAFETGTVAYDEPIA